MGGGAWDMGGGACPRGGAMCMGGGPWGGWPVGMPGWVCGGGATKGWADGGCGGPPLMLGCM